MPLIVMFKRNGKIVHRRCRIRLRHDGNIVTLHGLDEAFSHAVTLWAADWRRHRLQAYL